MESVTWRRFGIIDFAKAPHVPGACKTIGSGDLVRSNLHQNLASRPIRMPPFRARGRRLGDRTQIKSNRHYASAIPFTTKHKEAGFTPPRSRPTFLNFN